MCAIFAANNLDRITVSFFPFQAEASMPVYVLFLGSMGIGLLCGALLMWLSVLTLRMRVYTRDMEIRTLKRTLDRSSVEQQMLLEKAADQTRALPSS
nr:LapA family protein [Phaeovibrio sulfidiphilus]